MKYTKVPTDLFEHLQLNTGILVEDFDPTTGEVTGLLGATTGGITFNSNPEYEDYADGVDNLPLNTAEMKKIKQFNPEITGTFVSVSPERIKMLIAAADIDENYEDETVTHIVPRTDINMNDFTDLWWVGDYSDVNTGEGAGFLAIHVMNTLSTGGYSITAAEGKGQHGFTFTGHYTLAEQDTVPFEIYAKKGESEEDEDEELGGGGTTPGTSDTTTP